MQRRDAVPFLAGLLRDSDENPITRHEAAEALAAIEAPESIAILEMHAADTASEVSETCQLALRQLQYKIEKGQCGCERRPQEALQQERLAAAAQAAASAATAAGTEPPPGTAATGSQGTNETLGAAAEAVCDWRPGSDAEQEPSAPSYTYVSPAPAAKAAPVATLRTQLLDTRLPLFERYRALFALRDATHKEGERALQPLCEVLSRVAEQDSALLKHEVAFVLGQLEHGFAEEALCEAVRRESEHGMVRHEAAEALGAIGSPAAIAVLEEYSGHSEEILRESCWVALMWLQ